VPEAAVFFSSTNKVYGDLRQFTYRETRTRYECVERPNGFAEDTPLDFHSPYGCSKGAAEQYVADYARMFGLRTVVFRHSSMYGGRQYATYDQGWIGWFCQQALFAKSGRLTKPFTISGNGKQVRDVLHAQDLVSLYRAALSQIDKVFGQVFNIGGGTRNSLSLLELFALLEERLGTRLEYINLPPREGDQRVFVADITRARKVLGWEPRMEYREGIRSMLGWIEHSS
jgi:CDP-paratose 2-epimerase